jgi:hypothetical protein
MIYRFLRLFFLTSLWIVTGVLQAQNVGIGTTSPDANAVLELQSNNQGLLVPRMTSTERNAMSSSLGLPQKGLLVFDNDSTKFFYWNGFAWQTFGSGGSSGVTCLTLQQTYDGCTGSGSGRTINISGTNSVDINSANASSIALKSTHTQSGVAISAISNYATSQFAAIQATTISNYGTIGGSPPPTSAILGSSTGKAYAVSGQIASTATGEAGVFGNNLRTTGGHGVRGMGYNGTVGESNYTAGYGASGWNYAATDPGIGTFGQGITGIAGQSTNIALSYGVYSYDDGGIYNNLDVGVNFFAGGTKSFRIDNPLDPENKFLIHFCVESPEVLNLYRGMVVLDNNGEAVVILPDYFSSIDINSSYQLTPVGGSMPDLYIKNKITDGQFTIAGGVAGKEVSWTVYSERNDIYLKNNPQQRETQPLKTGRYLGKYVYPEGYGQTKEKNILYKQQPILMGSENNNGFSQPELQLQK